ncbi:MAG TPA: PadR family transcriptional regulator [Tepidisphaeraceae bacterium]|nr:PadR family transcriptional regulator [Tepidisphaeraceae bacterium]
MADQDLYSGLIRLHVLHHASAGTVFGLGMIRELRHHGYRVGPGTLYPILHRMEGKGYLRSKQQLVEGKARRVYAITARGTKELRQATEKVRELYVEMVEGRGEPSPAHPARSGGKPELRGGEGHSTSARRSGGRRHTGIPAPRPTE